MPRQIHIEIRITDAGRYQQLSKQEFVASEEMFDAETTARALVKGVQRAIDEADARELRESLADKALPSGKSTFATEATLDIPDAGAGVTFEASEVPA